MEPLFHIGQEVVAIKDNPQGLFKKGDEFEILNIFPAPCKCKLYVVQIFEYSDANIRAVCTNCLTDFQSDVIFFDQKDFAPLQSMGNMTIEEAILLVTQKEMV